MSTTFYSLAAWSWVDSLWSNERSHCGIGLYQPFLLLLFYAAARSLIRRVNESTHAETSHEVVPTKSRNLWSSSATFDFSLPSCAAFGFLLAQLGMHMWRVQILILPVLLYAAVRWLHRLRVISRLVNTSGLHKLCCWPSHTTFHFSLPSWVFTMHTSRTSWYVMSSDFNIAHSFVCHSQLTPRHRRSSTLEHDSAEIYQHSRSVIARAVIKVWSL